MISCFCTSDQAVPDQTNVGTQTDWKYPRNANSQYYPREFSTQELEELQQSDELATFVKNVEPRSDCQGFFVAGL